MRCLIRWSKRHRRWEASLNGGTVWSTLRADNEDDSSEAIYEAAEFFDVPTNEWEIVEEEES